MSGRTPHPTAPRAMELRFCVTTFPDFGARYFKLFYHTPSIPFAAWEVFFFFGVGNLNWIRG